MNILEFILNFIFGTKQAEQSPEPKTSNDVVQTEEHRDGYIDYTDMKQSVFLAMTGGNSQNTDEIKRKLQQGCAKGAYPFTFSVGGWMYTISKLPDQSDHEMYGLQYKAEPFHQ